MYFSPRSFVCFSAAGFCALRLSAAIIHPDITESSTAPTGVFVAEYNPDVPTGSVSARNQVEGAARADRGLGQGFTPVAGAETINALTVRMSGADAVTNDWSTLVAGSAILKLTIYEAVDSGSFLPDGTTPAGTLLTNLSFDMAGSSVSADGDYLTFSFDPVAVNPGLQHAFQLSWNDDAVGNASGLDDDLQVFNVAETNPGDYAGGSRYTFAHNRPNIDWDLDAELRVGDVASANDLHFFVHGTIGVVTPTWAGYPIDENGWIDTGSWLGFVNVTFADWVYLLGTDTWAYIKESTVKDEGAWAYVLR